jgi:hypothetical protein
MTTIEQVPLAFTTNGLLAAAVNEPAFAPNGLLDLQLQTQLEDPSSLLDGSLTPRGTAQLKGALFYFIHLPFNLILYRGHAG